MTFAQILHVFVYGMICFEGLRVLNWLPYSADVSPMGCSRQACLPAGLSSPKRPPTSSGSASICVRASMHSQCTALREANGGHTLLRFANFDH